MPRLTVRSSSTISPGRKLFIIQLLKSTENGQVEASGIIILPGSNLSTKSGRLLLIIFINDRLSGLPFLQRSAILLRFDIDDEHFRGLLHL